MCTCGFQSGCEEKRGGGGKVFHISSLAVKKLTLRKSFGQILAV